MTISDRCAGHARADRDGGVGGSQRVFQSVREERIRPRTLIDHGSRLGENLAYGKGTLDW